MFLFGKFLIYSYHQIRLKIRQHPLLNWNPPHVFACDFAWLLPQIKSGLPGFTSPSPINVLRKDCYIILTCGFCGVETNFGRELVGERGGRIRRHAPALYVKSALFTFAGCTPYWTVLHLRFKVKSCCRTEFWRKWRTCRIVATSWKHLLEHFRFSSCAALLCHLFLMSQISLSISQLASIAPLNVVLNLLWNTLLHSPPRPSGWK